MHLSYLLSLFMCLVQTGISTPLSFERDTASNSYETDSDTYWKSISYFTPRRGQRYSTLTRRKSMYFALKFLYYGKHTYDSWENIMRIGKYGTGTDPSCHEHGDRFPGLFILPSSNSMQISLSDQTEGCWYVIENNYNLEQNVIYSLIIDYNQTYSTIAISATDESTNAIIEPLHIISNRSRTNNDTKLGKDVDIIISDPLTIPANVLLWDILIISYDNVLTFPTPQPTIAPTEPVRPSRPPRPDEAFGVNITVAMDYNTNNTNRSETDEVIREITEDILNNYIHKLSNASNTTVLHVVITDVENMEYDIILKSGYSTDNETAIVLEAIFENQLETELLNKIGNGSISVGDISIEVTVTVPSIEEGTDLYSTENSITEILIVTDNNNMPLMWIFIAIGSVFVILCICMAVFAFYLGRKCTHKKAVSRNIRVKSSLGMEDDINETNIGNIQSDRQLEQHSDENEYESGPILANEEMDMIVNKRNVRNTILEVSGFDTPSGPILHMRMVHGMNNIQFNQLHGLDENDMDEDELEELYEKPSNITPMAPPHASVEGNGMNFETSYYDL